MKNFIEKNNEEGVNFIKPITNFNDDEFSLNDLELMDSIIEKFGKNAAKDLMLYTHRENSPWYNTAKENNVLDLLENEFINSTDFIIDMGQLIAHDNIKSEIYLDYLESN